MAGPVYEFGDFRLDCSRFELLRDGRSLRLERKPMELLILLASSEGRLVSRAEIAQRLWDREVFVDTEHGINTAVRKIRTVLRDDPEEPRFLQTVPGMGYRFVAPTILSGPPHPVAEPQPGEAAGRDPSIKERSPGGRRARLWLDLTGVSVAAVLIMVLAAGPHALLAHLLHRDARPVVTSIAVLPLDNLSGDAGQEYFADGMTDELTTMLAKNSTLRVVSRTSAMQYKGVHRPLREIAGELGVDGIVEGSVARTSDRIHITLQLIRADSDTHLWAESYDREVAEAGSLPREAAIDIAKQSGSLISQATAVHLVNPAAHDAYLHGLYLWYGGWESNEKAGEYFKKAIQLQPDYAAAWAGLALYYGQGAVTGDFKPEDSLAPFESAAAKAVALDDSLPEAHLAMSGAVFMNRWDLDGALREVNRAIELDPRFAEAYNLKSMELSVLNRYAEAIEARKKVTELDPTSHPWGILAVLNEARQFDAAIKEGQQRLEANPRDLGLLYTMYDTYRRKGMDKEAVDAIVKLNIAQGNFKEATAVQQDYKKGGYKAVVRRNLSHAEEESKKEYVPPVELATQFAQLGDRERTISLLEDGFREHSPKMLWIQTEPAFDFLHADPRYRALIQRIGLPPAY